MFPFQSRMLRASVWSIYFYFALATARALTIPARNTGLDIGATPSALSASLPPVGFTIGDPEVGTVALSSYIVFQSITTALEELVASPFESRVSATRYYPYANLLLVLTGPSASAFDVKFMVWGLTLIIRRMVDLNSFRNYRFRLNWNGNSVGLVWLMYRTPRNGLDTNNTAISTIPQPSNLDAIHVGIKATDLSTRAFPPFTLNDAMMAIISGLTDIAPNDILRPVPHGHIVSTWPPSRGQFSLTSLVPQDTQVWFHYLVVLNTLRLLARQVLLRVLIPQMQITIYCNSILCGSGSLILMGPSEIEAGANITVA
ncbi:MAG: hypothetical protein Q9226_002434 [Calogaya cf. arnoldii]